MLNDLLRDPEAAVAILHAIESEDSVLLIRRAEREGDPWSGHWSFPGGRRDHEDPDLLHTALRELAEECGIQLGRERLKTALPPMRAGRRPGTFVLVAPFLFRIDSKIPAIPDAREAVEAAWIPISMLLDPARHSLMSVPGVPPEILYPAINLTGTPLWGFTYRVMTEWLRLGPKQGAIEDAGFQVACQLLNYLVQQGLSIERGWADRGAVKAANVRGVIPVTQVLAHLSIPNGDFPHVSALEVRADYIRIAGLAFEEYFIYASAQ